MSLAVLTGGVVLGIGFVMKPGPNVDTTPSRLIAVGERAPALSGTTLEGHQLSLADERGRPVIVNFWGPSCVPCRDEFALFKAELSRRGPEDLALIGVLMFDPPAPAQDFVSANGATWPTIDDPDGSIRAAYRAVARPQTYFIDRDGILRGIQVGQLTEPDFDRLYGSIAGPATTPPPAP